MIPVNASRYNNAKFIGALALGIVLGVVINRMWTTKNPKTYVSTPSNIAEASYMRDDGQHSHHAKVYVYQIITGGSNSDALAVKPPGDEWIFTINNTVYRCVSIE